MSFPRHHSVDLCTALNLDPSFFGSCCNRVTFDDSGEIVWINEEASAPLPSGRILYSIRSVKPYLRIQFREMEGFTTKRFPSVNSYAIMLDKLPGIDAYMQQHFNKKYRGNTMRALRRLESSYAVKYERFYGEIDRDICDLRMGQLKGMIEQRFKERGEESDTLRIWDSISDNIYNHILDKKASLFVISERNFPISISVCYHYGRLIFYYITSYDISYSKFSPGILTMYRQLEWSISNNYKVFDMGHGDLEYKRWWSNRIDTTERYMWFNKKSPLLYVLCYLEGYKTSLMAYLISKKVNIYYKKALRKIGLLKTETLEVPDYSLKSVTDLNHLGTLDPLDEKGSHPLSLKTALNDHLYHTGDHISDVSLLYAPEHDAYIIKGKEHIQQVVYSN